MLTVINRSLSLLVYFAYIAAGFIHGGGSLALRLAIGLLLPIACIGFPRLWAVTQARFELSL